MNAPKEIQFVASREADDEAVIELLGLFDGGLSVNS